jgi:hypothetical protein
MRGFWVRLALELGKGNMVPAVMTKEDKAKLIGARFERVPWWRSALDRIGPGRHRRHEEALDRLAGRNMTDAVREEDIRTWLSTIETRHSPRPGKDSRS